MPLRKLLAALLTASIAASAPALAHHSHANYDVSRWTVVEGTVKQVVFIAPHSIVYLLTIASSRQSTPPRDLILLVSCAVISRSTAEAIRRSQLALTTATT